MCKNCTTAETKYWHLDMKKHCVGEMSLKCCEEIHIVTAGRSEAADVGKALELLREVVFIEHRVGAVLHHLQRHGSKNRSKLVDALRPTIT